jgi:ribonucleoside-diphosphate reductase alpha chain
MYLDTRDIDETMKIYMTAWEKGVKTTYYLHMKPRHTAEQSTVAVNKAKKIGKIGFGAVAAPAMATAKIDASEPRSFSMPLQTTLTSLSSDHAESPVSVSRPSSITADSIEKEFVPVRSSQQGGGFANVAQSSGQYSAQSVSSSPAQPSALEMTDPFDSSTSESTNSMFGSPQNETIEVQKNGGSMKVHAPTDPQDALICDSCQ